MLLYQSSLSLNAKIQEFGDQCSHLKKAAIANQQKKEAIKTMSSLSSKVISVLIKDCAMVKLRKVRKRKQNHCGVRIKNVF